MLQNDNDNSSSNQDNQEVNTMSVHQNENDNSNQDNQEVNTMVPEAQDTQGILPEIKGDTIKDTDKKEEKTEAEKAKEKQEKDKKKWENQLKTATSVIKPIPAESGVAWCPATAMTHFSIDLGEDRALKRVRTANGGRPIQKRTGEDIMLYLDEDEDKRQSEGEITPAPRVPRFWTAGEKNDITAPSYIYRGGLDYMANPPLYRVDSTGVQAVNNTGEGGAVFTYNGGMKTIPAEIIGGDIKDIEELWKFINLSPEYRTLALGAVLAPVVNSHMERPVIFTTGPSETGKTTITERLSALVDPKPGGETSTRTNEGGAPIEQAALNTDTLIVGNISSVSLAASNALCQIGQGSTRKERKLYANGNNVEFIIRATAMISTKEEHIRLEDDLQTRIIPLPTTPLTQEQRKKFPSAEEWEQALPRLQAAALSIISAIKRDAVENPGLRFNNPYRWTGVGEVIERTERVLIQAGIKGDTTWTEALKDARGILSHRSTPVWVDFLIDELSESVAGSPLVVLKKMKELAGSSANDWYVSQQNFRRELEQHQEVLEEAGVGVDIVETVGGKKPRYEISIKPTAVNSIDEFTGGNILEKR